MSIHGGQQAVFDVTPILRTYFFPPQSGKANGWETSCAEHRSSWVPSLSPVCRYKTAARRNREGSTESGTNVVENVQEPEHEQTKLLQQQLATAWRPLHRHRHWKQPTGTVPAGGYQHDEEGRAWALEWSRRRRW